MKQVLAITMMTAGLLSAGSVYEITDLGEIGGNSSAAYAINEHSLAVGGATDAFGNMQAVYGMGSPWNILASDATASDVNDAGAIVGTQWVNGESYATVWQGGSPQVLGGADSYALGINNQGQVTGAENGRAFLAAADGTVTDLGAPAGAAWASGYEINDAGQVAGYSLAANGSARGFVWSEGSGFLTLGTLGGASSYAMSINESGVAAGHAQTLSGYLHAVLWTGGTIQDLGTLAGGNSYGYDVNDAGHVVGYSWVDGVSHAFLYRDGVMLDLNGLIDPGSGWVLNAAYGINNAGQIAGWGTFGGVERAFRLDLPQTSGLALGVLNDTRVAAMMAAPVPEPQTWVMLLTGAALCGLGAWRRQCKLR